MVIDRGDQLLEEESQQCTADGRQVEVVDHEEAIELVGRAIPHQFPPAKDYYVVDEDGKATLLHRRHGGNSWLEVKVLGMVAHDGREGLVEDRP